MMEAGNYILRFEGTLTQGGNAGKSYTFATSWGGKSFATEKDLREYYKFVRDREPGILIKLIFRKFVGKHVPQHRNRPTTTVRGSFEEIEIPVEGVE